MRSRNEHYVSSRPSHLAIDLSSKGEQQCWSELNRVLLCISSLSGNTETGLQTLHSKLLQDWRSSLASPFQFWIKTLKPSYRSFACMISGYLLLNRLLRASWKLHIRNVAEARTWISAFIPKQLPLLKSSSSATVYLHSNRNPRKIRVDGGLVHCSPQGAASPLPQLLSLLQIQAHSHATLPSFQSFIGWAVGIGTESRTAFQASFSSSSYVAGHPTALLLQIELYDFHCVGHDEDHCEKFSARKLRRMYNITLVKAKIGHCCRVFDEGGEDYYHEINHNSLVEQRE